MIDRGTQKKVIVLKRTGSPYFSEAQFILREGDACEYGEEIDMAAEAERIISMMNERRGRELAKKSKKSGEEKLKITLYFLSGVLCGVGFAFIARLFLH